MGEPKDRGALGTGNLQIKSKINMKIRWILLEGKSTFLLNLSTIANYFRLG